MMWQSARGEPDFSEPKEEDTDYWNEDKPASIEAEADSDDSKDNARRPIKAEHKKVESIESAADADDAHDEVRSTAAAAQEDPLDAQANDDDKLDSKPPLTSWDMAKFANNVEAGGGTMGTK
jgi:hypothetical protein